MNIRRIISIIKKEIIQIRRDPPSLAMAFVLPVMMLLIFGYAVTTDVEHIKTVVLDMSKSHQSRQMVTVFKNTGYFDPDLYVESYDEINHLLDSGDARVGLIIPSDYAIKLHRGEQATLQLLVDGSDPLVARTALSTAQVITQKESYDIKVKTIRQAGIDPDLKPAVDLRYRIWYNPDMVSLKFNIPGLIGLIMQNITILLTAFAMVRERERGTLEQLIITPVKPAELIIGKLIPYIAIGFVDVLIILGFGMFWFNVPVKGSIIQLLIFSLVFLMGALGLGLFVSTVAKTQLQAMQIGFAIILPSVLLSGFMFPRESMPQIIQVIGYALPVTYFMQVLRGIILKGVGFTFLWKDIIILTAFAIFILGLSIIRLNKRLD
ncbi:ABC transporter permease [Phosphitispora sp. TUW77]|uniref:ABC transporter permease n=1 Tax=Phosphitispora sp. TUW77 TaxID=3152361 RepID=UPI003AB442C1